MGGVIVSTIRSPGFREAKETCVTEKPHSPPHSLLIHTPSPLPLLASRLLLICLYSLMAYMWLIWLTAPAPESCKDLSQPHSQEAGEAPRAQVVVSWATVPFIVLPWPGRGWGWVLLFSMTSGVYPAARAVKWAEWAPPHMQFVHEGLN